MKPAPLFYLMIVGGAILPAAIMICRDLDVPILWSTAIGVALWSWVLLLLWSAPVAGKKSGRRQGTRSLLRRAFHKSQH
jgi:hypothetical protein